MIPDKMYRYTNVWGDYICVPHKPNNPHAKYEEYTRTPIPKKFSEVKPEKDGEYLISYDLLYWNIVYFKSNVGKCVDRVHKFFEYRDPKYWSEIILPIIEDLS